MKYLRFCIFLLILSNIVSVYPNEELQSHLLDYTNFTLENGFAKYYTTYCYIAYDPYNCTNIITFYPNSNPNASAIIELGTQFSNYTISLNTSYTINDSNVELMPIMVNIKVEVMENMTNIKVDISYQFIKIFVLNLTSETSYMNVWDAMDHVYRRCEVASGGIPPSSGPECNMNLQCLAYVNCIDSNIWNRGFKQYVYIYSQIGSINNFLMTYIIIIPYVIGLLFSVLNVVLFIQLKSLKNSFMVFVAIQSFYCIFWFLCFFLFTASNSPSAKSLLGFQFALGLLLRIGSIQGVRFSVIALSSMFLCSFGIETIRFFKALSRVFALRFPLWFSYKLTIKHALFSCLSTFILGITAWVFVVLNQTFIFGEYRIISICQNLEPTGGDKDVLYIFFGWDCFPQYILYDELSPLNLITLLLDCYVLFLLKLSKLNDQQKRREKVLKVFIVMDLIDVAYSCFRRMLFFVFLHNNFLSYNKFSFQWGMFYYNAFARYIILALYAIDLNFFYVIRLIFYAVEMVVCQVLMRRIQAVENPHYVPRNFVDKFLMKFTKKFYTNVRRVQPNIMGNTTNIVGR